MKIWLRSSSTCNVGAGSTADEDAIVLLAMELELTAELRVELLVEVGTEVVDSTLVDDAGGLLLLLVGVGRACVGEVVELGFGSSFGGGGASAGAPEPQTQSAVIVSREPSRFLNRPVLKSSPL